MCSSLFVVAGIFMSTLGSTPTSLTGCMGHWGDLTGSMGRTSLEEREGRRTELNISCAFICLTWQLYSSQQYWVFTHQNIVTAMNSIPETNFQCLCIGWCTQNEVICANQETNVQSGSSSTRQHTIGGTPNFTTPVRRGAGAPWISHDVCARDY